MGVRGTKYNQPQGYSDLENRALKDSAIHTNAIREASTGLSATGGTKFIEGGYTYHAFISSDSFAVSPNWSPSIAVEYLIVGGGGPNGASGDMTAGGGGGGVLTGSNGAFDGGSSYTVTLNDPVLGNVSGGDSSIVTTPGTLTSGGGVYAPRSAGGASGTPQSSVGGDAYPYSGSPVDIVNGGGGGAGGAGNDGGAASGGTGGVGLACPEFPGPGIGPHFVPSPEIPAFTTAVGPTGLYGGGGGGGTYGTSYVATGGPGGGGDGGSGLEAGVNYTGGGAGGHYPGNSPDTRLGGKGLVVLRYSV